MSSEPEAMDHGEDSEEDRGVERVDAHGEEVDVACKHGTLTLGINWCEWLSGNVNQLCRTWTLIDGRCE